MSIYEIQHRPAVDEPVLLVVLEGFVDAGLASSAALERILDQIDTEPVAVFDADRLLDHRSRRPTMHLRDGVNTGLTWPGIELVAGSDLGGNDVMVLSGVEPDHEWRAFCRAVTDIAVDFDVRMVVGLGAYPAPVPHSRPTRLATTATSKDLARFAEVRGTLDVPAGIQTAIETQCAEEGIPALGLWAQVPHYAAAMPYPAAAATLIRALGRVADLDLTVGPLDDTARIAIERIESLISGNSDHEMLVRQLEHQYDREVVEGTATVEGPVDDSGGEIPSGDELAAEFQRFLREQDD